MYGCAKIWFWLQGGRYCKTSIGFVVIEAANARGAPWLQMNDFLPWGNGPIWARELQSSKWMIFLSESLRKRTNLGQGAARLQMDDFLIRILKETDQSEPGSSIAPNGWFSYFSQVCRYIYIYIYIIVCNCASPNPMLILHCKLVGCNYAVSRRDYLSFLGLTIWIAKCVSKVKGH